MIHLHNITLRPILSQNQKRKLADMHTRGRRVRIGVRPSGYVSPQVYNAASYWHSGSWIVVSDYTPSYDRREQNRLDAYWARIEDSIPVVRLNR